MKADISFTLAGYRSVEKILCTQPLSVFKATDNINNSMKAKTVTFTIPETFLTWNQGWAYNCVLESQKGGVQKLICPKIWIIFIMQYQNLYF